MEPPKPVFYRLYYNDQGYPICYTMEDLPGDYIEIDQATYALSPPNVRVVNQKIQVLSQVATISKLTPSEQGTACDPRDVCVVVDTALAHQKWSMTTYEIC